MARLGPVARQLVIGLARGHQACPRAQGHPYRSPEPKGDPHTFDLVLNLNQNGAPASAAFVDQVIAEVSRAKPVRSHFTFTQGISAQAGIGLIAAVRPTIYTRLSCTAPAA